MQSKVNSILLQLKNKKGEDLDRFEQHVKSELEELSKTITENNKRIERLEEFNLKCMGAMDQAVDLYVVYVETTKPVEKDPQVPAEYTKEIVDQTTIVKK